MRAALVTTAIVLIALLFFSWDRWDPSLRGVGDPLTTMPDVAAAPPATNEEAPETSPPPVPQFPDARYSTAGSNDTARDLRTHVIKAGDTLWSISVEHYGDGHRARAIYEANRDQIKDPANLRSGQELVLP